MGVTVRQKIKGKGRPWWVFVHQNGIIRSRKVGDRPAAEAIASELRRRLKSGQLPAEPQAKSNAALFRDYAQYHLEHYAKTACKRNTWTNYEAILKRHLVPAWGTKRLDEITRADVKKLILDKQQEGYAAGTVQNMRMLVSGIFTHACEDEILAVNPAARMGKFIRREDRRRHVQPLTRDQAAKLLQTIQQDYSTHYPFFLCAFRTGMRLGELVGLAWSDLDFAANAIKVQRSFSHGHFSTPKSRKFRIVDMSNQLKEELLAHRKRLLQRFRRGIPKTEVTVKRGERALLEPVFPNGDGEFMDEANLRHRVFYKAIEKADVPKIRIHDIRHTFASLLLTQGESLHYVKEQMGHASIQTTVDIYGHLVPGTNRNAVNRLDDPTALRIAGSEPATSTEQVA